MKRTIVWMKRDLRVEDHEPLAAALSDGAVLPLYVAEPELWSQPDRSARQWREHAAALAKLRASLSRVGLPLAIMTGDAASSLVQVARHVGATDVRAHQETGTAWTHRRDIAVKSALAARGVAFRETPQEGVARGSQKRRPDFLSQGPLETIPSERAISFAEAPIPEAAHLGLPTDACAAEPATTPAREILEDYCAQIASKDYGKDMWHAIRGASASSRLSVALSTGELSSTRALDVIAAHAEDAARRSDAVTTRALAQLKARIGWRRSFIQAFESNPDIEPRERALTDQEAKARFEAWRDGKTGVPLVDAVMRSLKETGWANFRMRHMAISFANHHLALDWSVTGRHLARLFVDYEPGIHWCQLSMMAGTPGHPRPNVYDPVKQGRENDPDEAFVRTWLPDLVRIPKGLAHEPWHIDPALHPIVDIEEARIAAIERMTGVPRRRGKEKAGVALLL